MKTIGLEFYKCKRRKMSLFLFSFLVFEFLWILFNIRRMDPQEKSQLDMYLLYSFPLLNSIIFPTVVATLAARLCDMEHIGSTYKLLKTLKSSGQLYDAKFICGGTYLLFLSVGQVCLMLCTNYFCGIHALPDLKKYSLYFCNTFFITLTLFLLQMTLSLLIKNQMIPFVIGLAGSFLGLFLMFLPNMTFLKNLIPWGAYGQTMLVWLEWDPTTRISIFHYTENNPIPILCVMLWFLFLYLSGRTLFSLKED